MFDKIKYRLVYNRKNHLNKNGEALIQIECLLNKKRIYFTTNMYLKQEYWDGNYVVNHPLANDINQYLFNEILKLQKIEFGFIAAGKTPTLKMLKNAVKNNVYSAAKLKDFVESINKCSATRGKHTINSYKTLIKIVERFKKDTTLEDIDIDWLNEFVVWQNRQKLSQSTISGRLKSIRAIINEAIARKIINSDDDPFKHFKIPKIKSRDVFLTAEEVHKLETVKLKGKRENYIRDVALFAIYTGFRFSDLNTLTKDNIVMNGGKMWIVKKPEKTLKTSNVTVNLPIYSLFDGKAVTLIEKYGSIEKLAHCGNNAAANRTLKVIMNKIGITDKTITFHTLRHTFVSLLIEKGIPITSVQKLVGHTKIDMTLNYSHVTTKFVENDVKKAFGKKRVSKK